MIRQALQQCARVVQRTPLLHASRPLSQSFPSQTQTIQPTRQIRSFRSTFWKKRRYHYIELQRMSAFEALIHNARPRHFVIIGLGASGLYFYNTDEVEATHRRRFNCVSNARELEIGMESYREILSTERGKILPRNHQLTKMVDGVLQRLLPGMDMDASDWSVHVIRDDSNANAFVLPGGKVFVYTGILPICKDEDGLAAVLGHEISHVVAHHTAERMSNSLITLSATIIVSSLFDVSGQLSSFLMNMLYNLPNSRTQEAEADYMGLMLMAKACFNPEAAVHLWARMHEEERHSPPQFMSTHPTSYNRMESIQGWLEKANGIYEENGCKEISGYMPGFRTAFNSSVSHMRR